MDICQTVHRNQVFLYRLVERVIQRVSSHPNKFTSPQIMSLVQECAGDTLEINKFFDDFTIEFSEWVINQPWEKTSASLGVDDRGQNIAKSTKELLSDFKEQRGIDPDIN